jgi:hypothetical protein
VTQQLRVAGLSADDADRDYEENEVDRIEDWDEKERDSTESHGRTHRGTEQDGGRHRESERSC